MKNQELPCVVCTAYCEEGAPATMQDLTRWAKAVSAAIKSRRYQVERTPEGFLAWHPAGIVMAYENPRLEDRHKALIRRFETLISRRAKQQKVLTEHERAELLDEDFEMLVDFSWEGYSV